MLECLYLYNLPPQIRLENGMEATGAMCSHSENADAWPINHRNPIAAKKSHAKRGGTTCTKCDPILATSKSECSLK